MSFLRRLWRAAILLIKILTVFLVGVVTLLLLGFSLLETAWGKDHLRELIVQQANRRLTATLQIGRLGGSILRGVQLDDIRLSRDGHSIISIDQASVGYSIRQLYEHGAVIQHVRLVRPRIVLRKQPDGRWNLGALIKRETNKTQERGPAIQIASIEIADGDVSLEDSLELGAVHVPKRFSELNTSVGFQSAAGGWRLTFAHASWHSSNADLSVDRLSGAIENSERGLTFRTLVVQTPRSAFTLDGQIDKERSPTVLDLRVRADRFAFQEWSALLPGLRSIAVDAAFDTTLQGPVNRLRTSIDLQSTGGAVKGTVTLDTTVPGWRGEGTLDVARLELARWLNRPDRSSDISGRVTFNLALQLGRHFPRGTYSFAGPHVTFMHYAADDLRAHGEITQDTVLIADAAARAYGADVKANGSSIGINDPFPLRFQGTVAGLDLRRLPSTIPVPHVQSILTFDYDVSGQFADAFVKGHARFVRSDFLGARVGEGTTGSLDTSTKPLQFGGDGELDGADLRRLGEGLDVGWLQDPRYAGTVSGRFHVDGAGTDASTLSLAGTGRISHAELFGGVLSNADVSIDIHSGTLRASYGGLIRNLDPALPLANDRVRASLTGTATVRVSVNELLTRTPEWQDYDIDGTATLEGSVVRDVPIERARVDAALHDSTLTIRQLDIGGAVIEGRGSGALALASGHGSDFQFDVTQADLSRLAPLVGQEAGGTLTTKGRLAGPWDAIRLVGTAIVNRLHAPAVGAETLSGDYDVVLPSTGYIPETARVNAKATFAQLFGRTVNQATGTITLARQELGFDLQVEQVAGRHGAAAGTFQLDLERREARLASLTLTVGQAPWRLSTGSGTPAIAWSDQGVTIEPLVFLAGAGNDQRFAVSGSWRRDGTGAIRINATHVYLETLSGAFERPARYAGVVDLDATISGTRDAPRVAGTMTITNGRVRGLSYERLSSRVDYQSGMFTIDARLEASGAWLTAVGTVPLSLFDTKLPEQEIKVSISSSTIQLGLIEGVTNVVRNVSGQASLNVEVIGTSRDVHFSGTLEANNAAFLVTASGGRYKNGRLALRLARDRITVDTLHVEDTHGHPLDVVGSLGTHELQIGEVEVDVKARNFELLRNELGNAEVNATLQLRGNVDKPLLSGDVAMGTGNLKVDEIMQRLVYQPYATTAAKSPSEIDPMAALNPWDRLALNISLRVPENLRLTGQEIQVASGTPLGIGSINLRVGGDLAVLKDAGQPMAVYGSFDSMSGSFTFQGRIFQIQPGSSINFRGSGSPEMYVTVARTISGVQARVTVSGGLANPELQLASTPPLDSSDILSLIVFNTSMNNLSTTQQSELAVRAGTLAAGFVATPLMSAIQRGLGLETLQLESAGEFSTGPKVTIGEEIAPGLVARFSRQFGTEEYNEAVIEYYLSRILQIRGTFSDAQSLTIRSPFTRVERAGIDLLLFFSF